jgi:hypothetical protein
VSAFVWSVISDRPEKVGYRVFRPGVS